MPQVVNKDIVMETKMLGREPYTDIVGYSNGYFAAYVDRVDRTDIYNLQTQEMVLSVDREVKVFLAMKDLLLCDAQVFRLANYKYDLVETLKHTPLSGDGFYEQGILILGVGKYTKLELYSVQKHRFDMIGEHRVKCGSNPMHMALGLGTVRTYP